MTQSSNHTPRLLDAVSVEQEVNNGSSRQPDLPPPYHMVAGIPSVYNRSVSGQNSIGNNQAPVFNQPPTQMFHIYSHPQSSAGPVTLPTDISSLPPGQRFYLLPGNALPASSGQPWNHNKYGTHQTHSTTTQSINVRAPRNTTESEPDNNGCCSSMSPEACMAFWCVMIIMFIMFYAVGQSMSTRINH